MYAFFYETIARTGWVMYPLFLLGLWGWYIFCSFAFFILRNKNALEMSGHHIKVLDNLAKNFSDTLPSKTTTNFSFLRNALIKILDVFSLFLYLCSPLLLKLLANKKHLEALSLEELFYQRLRTSQRFQNDLEGKGADFKKNPSLLQSHIYKREERNFLLQHIDAKKRNILSLKLISQLAPLLGLLGTVLGMIETFKVIALYGNSNPLLLTEGISKALLTTQAGLTLAFPFLFFYILSHYWLNLLRHRLNVILHEFSV